MMSMVLPILAAVLSQPVALPAMLPLPDGEVNARRGALRASEPNPDRIRGLLPAVVQSADPAAVSLLTDEYDKFRRLVREHEEEVSAIEGTLKALDELAQNLGPGQGIRPDLIEDRKLKLRKAEAERANSSQVLDVVETGFQEVLAAVAAKGNPDAFDPLLACFETESRMVQTLGDEDETTKGELAQVEFSLRRYKGGVDGRIPLIETQAKLDRRLDLVARDLAGHQAVRRHVLSAVASLMESMRDADRSDAAEQIEDRVGKKRPPTERALYMDLFAGLGTEKGPEDILKVCQKTYKEILRVDEDLVKLRDLYAKTLEAASNMLKASNNMIRVDLKEAMESQAAQLLEDSAAREALERLRRASGEALGLAVSSMPEGKPKERKIGWLLNTAAKEKVPENRAVIARSLGRLDLPPVREHLMIQVMEDKDIRVRVACLDAMVELRHQDVLPLCRTQLLKEEDWRMRVAAVQALREMPTKEAIPVLIEALAAETGRLREDITNALQDVTGQKFVMSAPTWQRWWDDNGQAFRIEDVQRNRRFALASDTDELNRGVTFYGISSASDRIVFVLDVSGSMAEVDTDTGRKKIDVALEELKKAVAGLADDASFNIVLFAYGMDRWDPRMKKVTAKVKEKANRWIDETVEAYGGTNLYGGIMEAFTMAGMGTRDEKYEPAVDTIFLLSDGDPSIGEVLDPTELRRIVRERNALNRIRIHAIGVGHDANLGLLYGLAEDSGGLFVKR